MLLSVSAFGPYVLKDTGVRLEHFVIYPSFGLVALLFIFKMSRFRIERNLFVFTAFWFTLVAWIVWISAGMKGEALGSLSTFENFLQPLALMMLVVVFSRYYRVSDWFEPVVRAFLVAMGFNSLIIALQVLLDPMLYGGLEMFVRATGDTTVAERAATVGRYLGIYDQPLEAGANYSLAVLSWAYLENVRQNVGGGFKYPLLVLIILGGLVTVSKVFVIGGLFLFLVYIFFYSRRSTRRHFMVTLPVLGGIVAYYLFVTVWRGTRYLLRLFRFSGGDQGLLAKYTAGRFGVEDSPVVEVFTRVYNESFIYGFGMAEPPILDNGFSQVFFHGGLIGLAIYAALLIWLVYKGWEMYYYRNRKWVFFLFIVALVWGLNVGGPAFTLNRFSVNVTLLLAMMLLMQSERRPGPHGPGRRPAAPPPGSRPAPPGERYHR